MGRPFKRYASRWKPQALSPMVPGYVPVARRSLPPDLVDELSSKHHCRNTKARSPISLNTLANTHGRQIPASSFRGFYFRRRQYICITCGVNQAATRFLPRLSMYVRLTSSLRKDLIRASCCLAQSQGKHMGFRASSEFRNLQSCVKGPAASPASS